MTRTALEINKNSFRREGGLSGDEVQLLTFMLGDELYGIDILRVREIKGYAPVTKIPNTPSYIEGVLNLRGTIVPVIELRSKFGMSKINNTPFTVIIIVVVGDKIMGLIVDSVSDVLNIHNKDIQHLPQFGAEVDVSFLQGIGQSGNKLVALLNVNRLLLNESPEHESGIVERQE